MNIIEITAALDAAVDSDVPTTKRDAKAIATALGRNALEALREYVDELDEALQRAEAAADELADADGDDRETAHMEVTEAAGELSHLINNL